MSERVTARVTNWNDKQRPWKAEILVDGYSVEKSYHATCGAAFEWCGERKKAWQQETEPTR